MCEPTTPMYLLKEMRFSLSSLAEIAGTPGSHERRNADNIVKGIRTDLDWCIAQLEAVGEGMKNMGCHAYQITSPLKGKA